MHASDNTSTASMHSLVLVLQLCPGIGRCIRSSTAFQSSVVENGMPQPPTHAEIEHFYVFSLSEFIFPPAYSVPSATFSACIGQTKVTTKEQLESLTYIDPTNLPYIECSGNHASYIKIFDCKLP